VPAGSISRYRPNRTVFAIVGGCRCSRRVRAGEATHERCSQPTAEITLLATRCCSLHIPESWGVAHCSPAAPDDAKNGIARKQE
jgi:hypothetical protein